METPNQAVPYVPLDPDNDCVQVTLKFTLTPEGIRTYNHCVGASGFAGMLLGSITAKAPGDHFAQIVDTTPKPSNMGLEVTVLPVNCPHPGHVSRWGGQGGAL